MTGSSSPIALEGWLEFNRRKWGLVPHEVQWSRQGSDRPALGAVLYLDRRGRVCHPPLNPYALVDFAFTDTDARHRKHSQWLEVSAPLVEELTGRGVRNMLMLPPEVRDVRPWQWAGFRVGVRYTFALDFPYGLECADKRVRNEVRKAEKDGYRTERTDNLDHVMRCLRQTERRQRFRHRLTLDDLLLLRELLGEEHFRAYVTYAPDGEPAAAQLLLHRAGAHALGWVSGGGKEHYRRGAAQLMDAYALDDLQQAGATGYDLVGANLPNIAAAKMKWGGELVPYYTVEEPGLRAQLRGLRDWWRFIRRGKGGTYVCCTFFIEEITQWSASICLMFL